jgi:hypothetical protein
MADLGARQPSGAGSALASEPEGKADLASTLAEPRLYVRDHTYKQYVLPYKLGREWKVSLAMLTLSMVTMQMLIVYSAIQGFSRGDLHAHGRRRAPGQHPQ